MFILAEHCELRDSLKVGHVQWLVVSSTRRRGFQPISESILKTRPATLRCSRRQLCVFKNVQSSGTVAMTHLFHTQLFAARCFVSQ